MRTIVESSNGFQGIGQQLLRPGLQNQMKATSTGFMSNQTRKSNGINNRFWNSGCFGQQ